MSFTKKIAPLDLFNYLREEYSFHLSLEDYNTFLDAVHKGVLFSIYHEFDYNNAIKELSRTLWVKSIDHANEYDKIFDMFISKIDSEQTVKTEKPTGYSQENIDLSHDGDTVYKQSHYTTIIEYVKKGKKGTKIIQEQVPDENISQKNVPENYENPPDDYNNKLYFPASRYIITNCFSKLLQQYHRPKKKFDIEATIQRMIDNEGKLIEYVYSEKKKQRQRKLCIMVDQSRSMRPFNVYTKRLVDIAKQVNGVTDNEIAYFDNTPDIWIYSDISMSKEHYLKKFLQDNSGAKIIIISDSGYARGGDNEYRLEMTRLFYDKLKAYDIKAIWINPLPRTHWFSIGVIQVDDIVPMVEMSEPDLKKAVRFLNEE